MNILNNLLYFPLLQINFIVWLHKIDSMISIQPNKNITTINISSKVFDNKRPYTPNQ